MLKKIAAVAGAVALAILFATAIWFMGGWPACKPIAIGSVMKVATCPSH